MGRSLVYISLTSIALVASCSSLPPSGLSNGADYGTARDQALAFESAAISRYDLPWLRLGDSWKRWPAGPEDIVVQGEAKLRLGNFFLGTNEYRAYAWRGAARKRGTESPIELMFSTWKDSSSQINLQNFSFKPGNGLTASIPEIVWQPGPDPLPFRFVSLSDNAGIRYYGQASLDPAAARSGADSRPPRIPGLLAMSFPRQKLQFIRADGTLCGESADGRLYLRSGLSTEDRAAVELMAELGEVLKDLAAKAAASGGTFR